MPMPAHVGIKGGSCIRSWKKQCNRESLTEGHAWVCAVSRGKANWASLQV